MNLQEIDMEKEYEQNLKVLGVSGADLVFMKNWLGFYRTQQTEKDRANTLAVLREGVNGKRITNAVAKKYPNEYKFELGYDQALDDILTLLQETLGEK